MEGKPTSLGTKPGTKLFSAKKKARKIRALLYPLGESNPCSLAENQMS
jgi:hypothetical protein